MDLASVIRDVPDFPQKGILFKDITTLLKNPVALKQTLDETYQYWQEMQINIIVGIESRGFMFGMPLAYQLGLGFVPVRKPGKLPAETIRESYTLEYGTNTLEMHLDAIEKGTKVLIVDDLLATGGTAKAAMKLVEQLGGEVIGFSFVIELMFLKGRELLGDKEIFTLVEVT